MTNPESQLPKSPDQVQQDEIIERAKQAVAEEHGLDPNTLAPQQPEAEFTKVDNEEIQVDEKTNDVKSSNENSSLTALTAGLVSIAEKAEAQVAQARDDMLKQFDSSVKDYHSALVSNLDKAVSKSGDILPGRKPSKPSKKIIATFTGLAIAAGGVGAGYKIWGEDKDGRPTSRVVVKASPSPSPSPSAMEILAACDTGWQMKEADHGDNNRWFADGIAKIKEAKTPEEAREAALVWHDQVKRDPKLLTGAYNEFVKPNEEADWDSVVEEDCITPYGEQIAASLLTALSRSEVTPENAPSTARNTGTNAQGEVTVAEKPGISGDRKAIKCQLADGRVIWILGRCGQPAFPANEKVKLPVGETDEKVPVPLPGGAPRNEAGQPNAPEKGSDKDDSLWNRYGSGDPQPTPKPNSTDSEPTQEPQPIETTPANDGGGNPGGGGTTEEPHN